MITFKEFVEQKNKKIVYNGSRNGNIVFKNAVEHKYPDQRGVIFTSDNKKVANVFGKVVTPLYVNFKQPYIVNAKENSYLDIPIPKEMRSWVIDTMTSIDTDSIVDWVLKQKKYDGIIIKNVVEGRGNTITADDYIGIKKDSFTPVINEGKLGKVVGSALIALNLAGMTTLQAKDSKPKLEITVNKNDASKLYRAIAEAETGSFSKKWIRTTSMPSAGSSAYGPVQITKTLVEDIASRYPKFKNSNKEYIDKFIKQGELFLKYGGKDMVKGFEKYDYGKSGDLTSQQDRIDYTKMAYDLMQIILKEKKYNLHAFIKRWRGKNFKEDPRYFKTVVNALK